MNMFCGAWWSGILDHKRLHRNHERRVVDVRELQSPVSQNYHMRSARINYSDERPYNRLQIITIDGTPSSCGTGISTGICANICTCNINGYVGKPIHVPRFLVGSSSSDDYNLW